jgi:hypothetical protein
MMAGFGSALARAAARGGKIQYKLSTERRTALQRELSAHEWGCSYTDRFYAYCGLVTVSDHENHSEGTGTL